MSATWKLAWAWLRREKKQTLALFAGILLAAALFSGVGSLFSSGRDAARENARAEYGDWHYELRCDLPWFEEFLADPEGEGFTLEKYGVETVRKAISAPFSIQYVSADVGYMEIMGRTLLDGKMPEHNDEIAMDAQTLRNLGVPAELGTEVTLDGETFTLSGIVAEMPEKLNEQMGDFMQVFVGPELDYGENGSFVYLHFDESRPVAEQIAAFCAKYEIDGSLVARNIGLAGYVGGDGYSLTLAEIVGALGDPSLGVPYVWGLLNENQAMTEGAMLLALAFCRIHHLQPVSGERAPAPAAVQRAADAGTDRRRHFPAAAVRALRCVLLRLQPGLSARQWGCVAHICAQRAHLRGARWTSAQRRGYGGECRDAGSDQSAGCRRVSRRLVADLRRGGFSAAPARAHERAPGAADAALQFASAASRRGRRAAQPQDHQPAPRKPHRRAHQALHACAQAYLCQHHPFAGAGQRDLSRCDVCDREHAHQQRAGLCSGRRTQLVSENGLLAQTIPAQTIASLRQLEGVGAVLPVSYMLGEIALEDGSFRWPSYYAETAGEPGFTPDPEIMARYGGVIVQTGEDDYRLKVNIYGYDDAMLMQLGDYLLEGVIDPDAMRREDSVIVKTLVDGQGNSNGIALRCGDSLRVKTPCDPEAEEALLQFDGPADAYQTTALPVCALVSRPLGKVDTTIGDDGERTVDIIMTQEQMQKHFGVSGYQTVSVILADDADTAAVADAVRRATAGISGCVVRDYSGQIAAQDLYLRQQMLFFYGIAAVLLVASLVHIVSSMHYLVAERRREFSILRAMGITDSGFLRMLAREGLRYGLATSLVAILCYALVQRLLFYLLQHVYLYLHPAATLAPGWLFGVAAVNILLCVGTMVFTGRQILRQAVLE